MVNMAPEHSYIDARALYIHVLKKCLTFWLCEGADGSIEWNQPTLVVGR